VRFWVRVTPRGRADEIIGVGESGELRARVMAAPSDGRANEALRRLIAGELGVAPSLVSIERGHSARTKQIAVDDVDAEEALRRWPGLRVR
jgi:uncharacterized protein